MSETMNPTQIMFLKKKPASAMIVSARVSKERSMPARLPYTANIQLMLSSPSMINNSIGSMSMVCTHRKLLPRIYVAMRLKLSMTVLFADTIILIMLPRNT